MKKFILLTSMLCFYLGLFAQTTDKRLEDLEPILNEVLSTWKAAGFAVAVVEKDKVIYAKGFGYRDVEKKLPVTPNTLFAIGSCTKAFTCAMLGKLVDEQKVDLEARPQKYIPTLQFHNEEMNNFIVVRDLMRHSTGLPRHDIAWYLFPTTRDSLMMRIAHQEPFAHVREQWYYNNFMFLTQGVIVEKVTGKTWEENMQTHFFDALEMKQTNCSIEQLKKAKEAALGYDLEQDSILKKVDYFDLSAIGPAGNINSSVNDMANWVITWINNGKFKDKTIVPPSFHAQAISSQMVITGALPEKEYPDLYFANYGLGWFLSSYKGHYRVEHGGNIDGFSASTCFFPSDSIGIVVLTNQDGSSIPAIVRNLISDRMLGVATTDWNNELKKRIDKVKKAQKEAEATQTQGSGKVANTRPSHILQEFTGQYSNPGYGSFRLAVQNDSLLAIFPNHTYWLKHHHYDVFEPLEIKDSKVDTINNLEIFFSFTTNTTGDIASVKATLEPTLEPIEFKRTPSAITITKADLEKYVGIYELSGIELKCYIKNENVLYLFVPGQPEYELLPTGKDQFAFKTLDGFKAAFKEGEDKKISSIILLQPNGTFEAKRK